MLSRKSLLIGKVLLGVVLLGTVLVACGDDGPTEPTNTPNFRVENRVQGPILFLHTRPCGTSNWSLDLLPDHPVDGTIQPGESKDMYVEPGCHDFRAEHLETIEPGPVVPKFLLGQNVVAERVTTWTIEDMVTPF